MWSNDIRTYKYGIKGMMFARLYFEHYAQMFVISSRRFEVENISISWLKSTQTWVIKHIQNGVTVVISTSRETIFSIVWSIPNV